MSARETKNFGVPSLLGSSRAEFRKPEIITRFISHVSHRILKFPLLLASWHLAAFSGMPRRHSCFGHPHTHCPSIPSHSYSPCALFSCICYSFGKHGSGAFVVRGSRTLHNLHIPITFYMWCFHIPIFMYLCTTLHILGQIYHVSIPSPITGPGRNPKDGGFNFLVCGCGVLLLHGSHT